MKIIALYNHFRLLNLTIIKVTTLQHIANGEGTLGLTALAKSLQISCAGTEPILDDLVERKLITRERMKDDRRKITLKITMEGRGILNSVNLITDPLAV